MRVLFLACSQPVVLNAQQPWLIDILEEYDGKLFSVLRPSCLSGSLRVQLLHFEVALTFEELAKRRLEECSAHRECLGIISAFRGPTYFFLS